MRIKRSKEENTLASRGNAGKRKRKNYEKCSIITVST
jgi:hypothetical protein